MAGRSLKGVIQVCAAKRRFPTLEEVNLAATPGLRGYQCVACGGYHLTSQSGPAPIEQPAEDRKPTFETSVLGRAKLVRSSRAEYERRIVWGECVSKAKSNGIVRVRIEGAEFETTIPVQPANVRGLLKAGMKLKVEFCPKPLHVRVLPDQRFG